MVENLQKNGVREEVIKRVKKTEKEVIGMLKAYRQGVEDAKSLSFEERAKLRKALNKK